MMKKNLIILLVVFLFTAVSSLADGGMKTVNFTDAGLEQETEGVTFSGGVITIRSPGDYMLSGTLTDGQICVDCAEEGKVTLYLNGVSVHSETSSAILIGECRPRAVLSLVDRTENTVSSGTQAGSGEDEDPSGAVFSQSDLTIEGSGSLKVVSGFMDGIVSKDDLVISGGKITVEAKRHGIRGKDSVEIYGGEITVTAGRDGIKSTNKQDADRGYVAIRGGVISIRCGDEPIQFVTSCTIENAAVSAAMNRN